MHKLFLLAAFSAAILLGGCATRPTVWEPMELTDAPSIRAYKNPDLPASYKTFTVVPASQLSQETKLKEGVLEAQLLFQLRNAFEANGYRFVKPDASPDFIVTLDGNISYKEKHVPTQTVTVPVWVPSETIITQTTRTGSVAGDPGGTSFSTIQLPGHYTYQRETFGGYTTGMYYPTFNVTAYDGKNRKKVWEGNGTGASKNGDLRVAGQFVLRDMLKQFPRCVCWKEHYPTGSGRTGLQFLILTFEGNDYYPMLLPPDANTPAADAGLREGDVILVINGASMQNKSFAEVMSLTKVNAGDKLSMRVSRGEESFEVILTAAAGSKEAPKR